MTTKLRDVCRGIVAHVLTCLRVRARWAAMIALTCGGVAIGLGEITASGAIPSPRSKATGHSLGLPSQSHAKAAIAQARRAYAQSRRQRQQPWRRRQRFASRYAYSGLGTGGAIRVASRVFHIDSASPHPLVGGPGDRVSRFLGNYGAVVTDRHGAHHAVFSTEPLAVGSGRSHRLISLALRRQGRFLTPAVSDLAVRISTSLHGGIDLPGGISLRPRGAANSPATIVGDQAFFANAERDTDFSAQPLPTGFETFWQLRSASSPEDYVLDFTLPFGVMLRPSHDYPGGAELMRGQRRLYLILPPSSKDADGFPVQTWYRVSANHLIVHVAHLGKDVHYPIQVDPSFWGEYLYGGPYTTAGTWPWWRLSPYRSTWADPYITYGNGLAASWIGAGSTNSPAGVYAVESLGVPGTAWVYRADFYPVYSNNVWFGNYVSYFFTNFNPPSAGARPIYTFNSQAGPAGSLPLYYGPNLTGQALTVCNNWSGTTDQYFPGICDPAATAYTPYGGNEVQIGMYVGTQIPNNTWSYGVSYGATVDVNDVTPPRNVQITTASPVNANGWMGPGASLGVSAQQPGLGIGYFGVTNSSGQTVAADTLPCQTPPSGFGTFDPCPQSNSATLNLGFVPDGTTTLWGHAQSVTGYDTASAPITVKIDRVAPSLSVSGGAYTAGSQSSASGIQPLTVSASDATSGVTSVQTYVDGQPVGGAPSATQSCLPGGCSLGAGGQINFDILPAGGHTIEVRAVDGAGNVATRDWVVVTGLSGVTRTVEGCWTGSPTPTAPYPRGFDLGPTFDGLPLSDVEELCNPDPSAVAAAHSDDVPATVPYLSLSYGSCQNAPGQSEGGCAVPLTIQIWPEGFRNQLSYTVPATDSPSGPGEAMANTDVALPAVVSADGAQAVAAINSGGGQTMQPLTAAQMTTLGNVPAASYEDGTRLEVYAGRDTTVVFADDAATMNMATAAVATELVEDQQITGSAADRQSNALGGTTPASSGSKLCESCIHDVGLDVFYTHQKNTCGGNPIDPINVVWYNYQSTTKIATSVKNDIFQLTHNPPGQTDIWDQVDSTDPQCVRNIAFQPENEALDIANGGPADPSRDHVRLFNTFTRTFWFAVGDAHHDTDPLPKICHGSSDFLGPKRRLAAIFYNGTHVAPQYEFWGNTRPIFQGCLGRPTHSNGWVAMLKEGS